MTNVTIEKGIAFFEDGSEVSNISINLIKAAPTLLKACKKAYRCKHHGTDECLEVMKNAIELAEGEV